MANWTFRIPLAKLVLLAAMSFTASGSESYMMTLDDMPSDEEVLEFVQDFRPDVVFEARRSFRNNWNAAAHVLLANAIDSYPMELPPFIVRYRSQVAWLLEDRLNRPDLQRYFRPIPAELGDQVAGVLAANLQYVEAPAAEAPFVNPPPQQEEVREIPESSYIKVKLEKEDTCAICQEDDKELCELKVCKHRYHPGCIGPWYKINNSCPLCRKKISD